MTKIQIKIILIKIHYFKIKTILIYNCKWFINNLKAFNNTSKYYYKSDKILLQDNFTIAKSFKYYCKSIL